MYNQEILVISLHNKLIQFSKSSLLPILLSEIVYHKVINFFLQLTNLQ